MLFTIFRRILWVVAIITFFIVIRKTRFAYNKKSRLISFFAIAIFLIIISIFPIENLIITFPTPESAYKYKNNSTVALTIEGEKSAYVLGNVKNNERIRDLVPKSKNGWKLGKALDIKHHFYASPEFSISVLHYKNTDDYYISVLYIKGGPIEISDNHGSGFVYLKEQNDTLKQTFYTYYSYIKKFDDSYYTLTINGNEIKMQDLVKLR